MVIVQIIFLDWSSYPKISCMNPREQPHNIMMFRTTLSSTVALVVKGLSGIEKLVWDLRLRFCSYEILLQVKFCIWQGCDFAPPHHQKASHLIPSLELGFEDALLASIAETEKQTELATRVSTWKQRIEKTLEEQDTHSPFDIHQYGDAVLDKLSLEAGSGGSMPFTDVVKGQPKHDVARTFSALLQLVNNGDVDLQRPPSSNSKLICYTAENPFRVKLLRSNKKKEEMIICSARKRVKSPLRNHCNSNTNPSTSEAISPSKFSRQNGRPSVKPAKGTVTRFTPDGKRRRRSRLTQNADLQPG